MMVPESADALLEEEQKKFWNSVIERRAVLRR